MENDSNPDRKWIRTVITRKTELVFGYGETEHRQTVKEEPVSDVEIEIHNKITVEWFPVGTNNVLGKTFYGGMFGGDWHEAIQWTNGSVTNMSIGIAQMTVTNGLLK